MRRTFVLALTFVLTLATLSAGVAAAPSQGSSSDAIPDRYIVVLDSGDPDEVAAEHSRRHGAQVRHIYRHALTGYAARMSEQAIDRVRRDTRVAYVEADREVTLAHHQCGHSGGPPGSKPPECDTGPTTGDVTGTVSDAEGGAGLEGATVTVEETGTSTTTDGNGDYRITDVDNGDATLTADAEGYTAASSTVAVEGDTQADFALTAEPNEDEDPIDDAILPWGVERVGAPEAHAEGRSGEGIHSYVLDTGIDLGHEDLAVVGGYAVVACEGEQCAAAHDDDHGHGTHVAGTAAALGRSGGVLGVAPESSLWAVKVLDSAGRGSLAGAIEGVDWVAAETAARGEPSVANMSLSATGSKQGQCTDTGFTGEDSFHQAVCAAKNAGVVFTVAAGNRGKDAGGYVPAAYDDAVVTVSATTDQDDWPSWSNWGDDDADWATVSSAPVALAAPGSTVLSTQLGGGTTTMSGTSMAAPHAAGSAALLLQAHPQAADGSAFAATRASLLDAAESVGSWTNTSGNPHHEGFLDAR